MARENLFIKVGKYTGDGASTHTRTDVGFQPQLVIIKGGQQNTVFRTKERRLDSTGFLTSTNTDLTTRIKGLTSNGFVLGNASQVNSSAADYYYLAIRGHASQNYFHTGNFRGDGADDRDFITGGVNFTPDLVVMQAISGSVNAMWRTSAMTGDTSAYFLNLASIADCIQNVQSGGFQLGTRTEVNPSGVEVFFFAMKKLAGVMNVGRFTGSGVARSITGVGFKPDLVIVKNSSTTDQARILTTDMVTDSLDSLYMFNSTPGTEGIKTLDTDGFTLGTHQSVNQNGSTMDWWAIKSGNFNAPVDRTAV